MHLWRKLRSFKTRAEPPDLWKLIGKTVNIEGKPVKITSIVTNMNKPNFYEINGTYLMSILRFHAQMLGDKSITEEEFLDWENMQLEIEQIAEVPPKKLAGQL
jgi:hypothetical protein